MNQNHQQAIPVLSVTSEAVPLIKTGGLADVAGALPEAMKSHGFALKTLLPAYNGIREKLEQANGGELTFVKYIDDLIGEEAHIFSGKINDTEFLLLEVPAFFQRESGIYVDDEGKDWPDNPERFAALSMAAAKIAEFGLDDGWRPQIIHAHDWQAGLAPAYLKYYKIPCKSVLTIHNIAFQGVAPADRLFDLRLPLEHFNVDGYEYYGKISTLKAALITADAITTVSPTYARELCEPHFGMGLDGLINDKRHILSGILNGVDLQSWNPETDPEIKSHYNAASLEKKKINRDALLEEFGISANNGPVAIVVSRLTHQKGLDLLADALPEFIENGGSLALLGSGDKQLEAQFKSLAEQYPGRVGVKIGYDEALSHRMFAGADAVIIPSRFEPCGLTQLYGLRYGTLPLVSRTGGLADTVIDANEAAIDAEVATGVVIEMDSLKAMQQGLSRLLSLYQNQSLWQKMQTLAMKSNLGWEKRAADYAALYHKLLG